MTCETLQGKYAEKLEREIKKMNKEIELLYKKLDAQDAIIDQQALEISQLKEQKKQVIEYIKWHYDLGTKENVEFCLLRDRLLDILGDKENE